MVIIRIEGTDCKPQTGYGSRVLGQGHKMVTSESEVNKLSPMKPAVCKSDLPEEMISKLVANETRMPPKPHQILKNKQSEIK